MEFDRFGMRAHRAMVAIALGLGAVAVGASTPAAAASNPVYTVSNYPVEAVAADAVTAKRIAVEEAQAAAFRSLLKRLVPVTAYGRLQALGHVSASELVDGMSVRAERNSATRYIASYDFAFSQEAVRDVLRREGVPFVDGQAPAITLVPVTLSGGQPQPALGDWGAIWKSLDIANALTPMAVDKLAAGVTPDTLVGLRAPDPSGALRQLETAYPGQAVVVATAEHDRPAQRLHVTLTGRDAAGFLTLARSYRVDGGDVAYAMELAAVVSLAIIEGRWKAIKARGDGGAAYPGASAGSGDGAIAVDVLFASPAEWYALQDEIQAIPGMEGLEVQAVSPRSAEVALNYPAGPAALTAALSRQGFALTRSGDRYVLRRRF
ncbi:MAG: DUF2066 domain-containing protein [Hyphomicrobiaceae bacterium]|nr:DUF2066 domain-containing protein [Hyphomicrobiaceae bacterium]